VTVVAVAGTKGALGVTTLCMALARNWLPANSVLVIEADPDGGVLGARLGVSQEPGLGTLAAAGRHELSDPLIQDHTQSSGDLSFIVAPSSPNHARAALLSASRRIGDALAAKPEATTLIDLGRLDSESPALPLAQSAQAILFLAAPNLEGADGLAVRLIALEDLRRRCHLVTVGEGPYEGAEIGRVLAIPHIGHLPKDPAGAKAVWNLTARSKVRRPLLRAVRHIAGELADLPAPTEWHVGHTAEAQLPTTSPLAEAAP
jgi:hypothetical protein